MTSWTLTPGIRVARATLPIMTEITVGTQWM